MTLYAAWGIRCFSPAFLAVTLPDLGVSDVVNEEANGTRALAAAGITHHALVFPDCTEPPAAIVAAFLAIVVGRAQWPCTASPHGDAHCWCG